MQLREVIKEIRRRKDWTQAAMASELGVSQQNIQGMENAGSNLEKQFAIFLKLVPVCRDLGIDPAAPVDSKATSAIKPTSPDDVVVVQLGRWAAKDELGREKVADSATPYEPGSTAQSQKEITRSYPTRRDAARKRPKRKH